MSQRDLAPSDVESACGWFVDPDEHGRWRFRDGENWTHLTQGRNTMVMSGPPPPVMPPQARPEVSKTEEGLEPTTSRLGRLLGRRTDSERTAEREFQGLLDEMVLGQAELAGLPARLRAAANTAGIGERQTQKRRDQAFRALAKRVLADDILTADEERELLSVADVLGIPRNELGSGRFDDLLEPLFVAQVNGGWLPAVVSPRLIVKGGEMVHAEYGAALMKEVVHREFRGGSSGVSVPIGLGIRVRTGGMRGRSVVTGTSLEPADHGMLSITDRRVVFLGAKKTQESRYDRLVNLEVFSDGIRLAVSNRQNASLFRLDSGPMAAAVLNGALQRLE